jgi:molybdate transport system substrate-binding protein
MIRWFLRYACCAFLVLLTGATQAATVTVFAAASLTDVMKEIASTYEKSTPDKVLFNFGASSFLARQIQEGAPADLFFSADEAKMDALEKAGLIAKGTRKSLLSNSLVIVVASEHGATVARPSDLTTAQVQRLALAEPATVPAGIYAKDYLQKQKLWPAVAYKVVPTENVRAALAAVEAGNADAGIVYKTDAAISKKVKIACEIPSSDGPRISYPVAILDQSPSRATAERLLKYFESDDARKMFLKYGFGVMP